MFVHRYDNPGQAIEERLDSDHAGQARVQAPSAGSPWKYKSALKRDNRSCASQEESGEDKPWAGLYASRINEETPRRCHRGPDRRTSARPQKRPDAVAVADTNHARINHPGGANASQSSGKPSASE